MNEPAPQHRREFARRMAVFVSGLGLSRAANSAATPATRKLKIGHTGITWGNDTDQAVAAISSLGYSGFETFGNVIEAREASGGVGELLDQHRLPLISAYCSFNMTDPSKRKEEMDKLARWAGLLKKYGAHVCVLGPNGVPRAAYDFKASRANIVSMLNDASKMLVDMGLTPALHQHTGTCIETREEVYAVLNAVDTRYVKFGPDVGQLAKGGSDPVAVVKDFLPLIRHMHLKDYSGGESDQGYSPLGQGKVNIPAILDMLENGNTNLTVMVELDPSPMMPIPPKETAAISRSYLQKLGYHFATSS
jgi:inosose dehydratase